MKQIIFAFFLCLIYSCSDNKKTDRKIDIHKYTRSDSINSFFSEELEVFDMAINDSAELVFSRIKSFDTSFILIINQNKGVIRGKFLYYPPSYYKDLPENPSCFLYKAVNFKLSVGDWDLLRKNIDADDKNRKKSTRDYLSAVLHPAYYKLFYKNSFYKNKEYDNNYFGEVREILNLNLLNEMLSNDPIINGNTP